MGKLRRALLATVGIGGAVIAILSFVPWLHISATILCLFTCHDTQITGFEVSGITAFGDGYVVLGLGSVIVALAGAHFFIPKQAPILASAIALTSLGVLIITTYNAFNLDAQYEQPTWALYAEIALPIILALCAAVLLTMRGPTTESDIAP